MAEIQGVTILMGINGAEIEIDPLTTSIILSDTVHDIATKCILQITDIFGFFGEYRGFNNFDAVTMEISVGNARLSGEFLLDTTELDSNEGAILISDLSGKYRADLVFNGYLDAEYIDTGWNASMDTIISELVELWPAYEKSIEMPLNGMIECFGMGMSRREIIKLLSDRAKSSTNTPFFFFTDLHSTIHFESIGQLARQTPSQINLGQTQNEGLYIVPFTGKGASLLMATELEGILQDGQNVSVNAVELRNTVASYMQYFEIDSIPPLEAEGMLASRTRKSYFQDKVLCVSTFRPDIVAGTSVELNKQIYNPSTTTETISQRFIGPWIVERSTHFLTEKKRTFYSVFVLGKPN